MCVWMGAFLLNIFICVWKLSLLLHDWWDWMQLPIFLSNHYHCDGDVATFIHLNIYNYKILFLIHSFNSKRSFFHVIHYEIYCDVLWYVGRALRDYRFGMRTPWSNNSNQHINKNNKKRWKKSQSKVLLLAGKA